MRLHEILQLTRTKFAQAPALIMEGTTLTFGELDERSDALAAHLSSSGEPGDRVVVVGQNHPSWCDVLYGVPRAGQVLVPINDRLTPAEQVAQVRASGASVLVGSTESLESLRAELADADLLREVIPFDGEEWQSIVDPPVPQGRCEVDVDASQPAWMIFTSGTTGQPKGALLSHSSLMAAVMANSLGRPVRPGDVYISAYPLYHVSAMNLLIYHFHGCPVVLLRRFEAAEFAASAVAHDASTTTMAPTMLLSLLDHMDRVDLTIPRMRRIGYGAAPIPPDLLARARRRLSVEFSESYGMTEMSGAVVFDGRPSPLVGLRLVDNTGADVEPGEAGEILLRGDQMMLGYHDDRASTQNSIRGGWLHTGDIGRVGPDGRLEVVGRIKDIIISGGENVMAREVEDVIRSHPSVADVAVIGVADATWGEAICAVVVRRDGSDVSAEEITDTVAARLARFKRPRRVEFVDALPVTATGKVDKVALRTAVVG